MEEKKSATLSAPPFFLEGEAPAEPFVRHHNQQPLGGSLALRGWAPSLARCPRLSLINRHEMVADGEAQDGHRSAIDRRTIFACTLPPAIFLLFGE